MLNKLLFKLNSLSAWRWELLKLKGFPICVDSSWFLIFFIYTTALTVIYLPTTAPNYSWISYTVAGFITVILFFSSVLAHELAHCYFARRAGIEIRDITLYLFGGLAHLSQEASHPWDEIKIAAAGPLASFLLAYLFFCISSFTSHINLLHQAFNHLSIVNFALACFNLLPGFPMDGGRILRATIWYYSKNYFSATQFSLQMGNKIALVLITVGILNLVLQNNWLNGIWSIVTGLLLIKLVYDWGPKVLKAIRNNPPTWQPNININHKKLNHHYHFAPTEITTVSAIMDKHFDRINPNLLASDFMQHFSTKQVFFLVIQEGRLHGILDYKIISNLTTDKQQKLYVKDVMIPVAESHFLLSQTPLTEAEQKLESNGIGVAAVLDSDGYVIGYLSKNALQKAKSS
jgi:Zn-dependent protease